jgi:hypothetical protein
MHATQVDKRSALPSRPQSAPPNLDALERQLKALQRKKNTLGREVERLDKQIDGARKVR